RESSVPVTPSVPPPASQHSTPAGLPPSRAKPPTEGAGSPAKASQASKLRASKEEKEEDWLSHALSRKKSQGLAREQHAGTSEGLSLAGTAGHPPSGSLTWAFCHLHLERCLSSANLSPAHKGLSTQLLEGALEQLHEKDRVSGLASQGPL
ncbi:FBF1 isoform 10, partial [Pongo abelii]